MKTESISNTNTQQGERAIDNGCDKIEISNIDKNGYLFLSSKDGAYFHRKGKR